jgi:hypothetical protein
MVVGALVVERVVAKHDIVRAARPGGLEYVAFTYSLSLSRFPVADARRSATSSADCF